MIFNEKFDFVFNKFEFKFLINLDIFNQVFFFLLSIKKIIFSTELMSLDSIVK